MLNFIFLFGSKYKDINYLSKKELQKDDFVMNKCYEKRLYSIKDLATEIGCTEWFWRTQIWDGKLAYIQAGRKILVDAKDLEDFIQSNKKQYLQ